MHRLTSCVFLAALLLGGLAARAPAQDTWTGASGPLWTTDNNWFLFAVPAPGADVVFDANAVGNYATVLGADFALNSLTLADPPAAVSVSSNLLTLGAGGVNMAAALQNLTLNARVQVATAQTWAVNAGVQLQVAGLLEGPGSLLKTGAGTAAFSANGSGNVFSGSVTVAEGTVLLNGAANQPPWGTHLGRIITVSSNASLTANNGTHNPLGTETVGVLGLVISNGTFNVPAYCHLTNLTMWSGAVQPNGAMVDGLDLRTGARVTTRASDNPASVSAKTSLRALTVIDVEDGAATVDLSWSGQIAGNNQTLVKTNAGTLELAGATDNVALALRNDQGKTILAKASGPTVHALGSGVLIHAGELELGGTGNDQIYSNLNVVVNGGLFDLNGRTEGFGALAGTNGVVRNDDAAAATLTVGENGNSGSFSGVVTDGAGTVALVKVGTGNQTLAGTNTISGGVAVNGGTLQVDGALNGSAVSVAAGAVLQGVGSVGGDLSLAAGARMIPGTSGAPRTLTVSSNLVQNAGTTNLFDLANPAVVGGSVNDLVAVGGNVSAGGALVQPRWLAAPQAGSYRLINYAGSMTGDFTLPTNTTRYTMTVDTATVSEVNLLVAGTPGDLRWNGTTNNVWNFDVAPNWYDIPGAAAGLVFRDFDRVRFDDTVGVTTTVAVTGTVQPLAVVVENSTNLFTLAGAGKISGFSGITKLGTSVLVVANTGGNDFTGPVVVSQGVFRVGVNAALGKSAGVTVAAGAKVDLNGVSQAGQSYAYTIAGAGPDGSGAVFNAGAYIGSNSGCTGLTLSADAAVGAYGAGFGGSDSGRVDVGVGGWIDGGGFTLTKLGNAAFGMRGVASNLAAVIVSNGMLFSENVDDSWGTNLIVESSGRIGMYQARRTTAAILLRGGYLTTWGSTASTYAGPITLASNSFLDTVAPYTGYGSSEIFVAGPIGGSGRLTKLGGQVAHLTSSNAFSGGLVINNGGGQINVNSSNGPAIASNVQLGHGVDGGGTADIRCYQNGQFAPGVVVSNRTTWNDWTRLILLGTTQTIAGIDDELGAGCLFGADTDAGVTRPSVLVIDAATDHQFNGFLWDRNTTNSTTSLRIIKTGPGTQGLSGSVKWGLAPLSGGLVISNGFVNLQTHRVAGSSTIELAGGGLQLDAPGLLEGNMGTAWPGGTNTAWAVKRTPHFATLDYGDLGAWDNTCWAYTGFIRVTNAAPVTWSFGENYDDNVYLTIDDAVVLNNTTWNVPTVGTVTLTPGLHRFDLRVYDGSGGAGPNGGFTVGVGIDYNGLNQTNAGNFVKMQDDGTGNLFLTQVTITNPIQLRAHAFLKSSFSYGPTNLIRSAITESGGSFGLIKVGDGALDLSSAGLGFTGPLTVDAGQLILDQNLGIARTVTVRDTATFIGAGTRGATTVEHGGTLRIRAAGGGETNYVAPAVTLGDSAAATTRVAVVVGSATNILVATDAGGLTASGTVILDVTAAGALYGGTTDLIRYSGTLNGSIANFQLGVIPTNLIGTASLQDSGSAIQLVLTAGSSLYWVGTPNLWDVGGNANWVGTPGGPALTFANGNGVTFDDTAANFTVDVGAGVAPGSMLVEAVTNSYLFSGLNAITGTASLVKRGAGLLTLSNLNAFTGPVSVSGGVVAVSQLADAGIASPLGAQSAASNNLVLSGGTLRYTGGTATNNRSFTVGPDPGVFDITQAGTVLSINTNWFLQGQLVKRGPGTLRLANYRYGTALGVPEVLVEDGTLQFDSSYNFTGTTLNGGIRLHITNGATVLFSQQNPLSESPGSLEQLIIERGCTFNSPGAGWYTGIGTDTYLGEARIILRGGRAIGNFRVIPNGGLTIASKASDTSSYFNAQWNPRPGGTTWTVDVEDGTAEPDFIQDNFIYGNITVLNKTGAGSWSMRGQHAINGGTLNVQSGVFRLDDGAGTLNGGTPGAVNVGGTLVFNRSATVTENDLYAGTGTVVQAGPGVTILSSTSTFAGATFVSGGVLRVDGIWASGATFQVTSGGMLGGVGVVSGTVVVAGAVSPGASVGTLSTGSEVWEPGGTYRFEVSDLTGTFGAHPGFDRLSVGGDLTINATPGNVFTVRVSTVDGGGGAALPAHLSANSAYTMALARVTGAISGFDPAAFAVNLDAFATPYAVTNARVEQSGSDVQLVLQTGGAVSWDWDADTTPAGVQDGDGNWDFVNTNWWGGTANTVWPDFRLGVFGAGTNSGGSYTVSVAAASVNVAGLNFPAGSTYTLAGTNLINVLGGVVAVSSGSATISARLGGSGLIKEGTGTLVISRTTTANPNFTDGIIDVRAGTLVAAGGSGDGVIRTNVLVRNGAAYRTDGANQTVNWATYEVQPGGLINLNGQADVLGNFRGGGTITNLGNTFYLDYLAPGVDQVFWGSLYGSGTLYVDNNQTRGGTQWLNGTNSLPNINIEGNNIVRFSSNGVTTLTGGLYLNPGGATDGATVIVEQGHQLRPSQLHIQQIANLNGTVNQLGGTVDVYSNTDGEGPLRIAHFPGDTSYYNLQGGTLLVTGSTSRVSIGIDGTGVWNIASGTASVTRVDVNGRNGGGHGFLNMSGGVVRVGTGGFFGNVPYQVTFAGGTLSALAGYSLAVTSSLSGAVGPLKVDPNGQTIRWDAAVGGAGSLVLDGAGTLALNGLYAAGPLWASNGVLGGTGTINAAVGVAAPAVVQPGYAAVGGMLTVSTATFGALAQFNPLVNGTASVLRVSATNGLTLPSGTNVLRVGVLNTALVVGTYTILDYEGAIQGGAETNLVVSSYPPRSVMYLTNNTANTSIDLVIVSLATDSIKWLGSVDNVWDIQTTSNWLLQAGALTTAYVQVGSIGDAVLFDDTALGNFSVALATNVSPMSITVSNEVNPYALSGAFGLGGVGSLTKRGAAQLTLSTSNSYVGGTVLLGGTLQAGSASALGRGPVANGGFLSFSHADTGLVPGVISGTGALSKAGSGMLVLTNFSTFAGGTTVSGGVLRLGAGGSVGTIRGTVNVEAGAVLDYSADNAFGYTAGQSVNILNISGGQVGGPTNNFGNHFWNNFRLNMQGGTLYLGGTLNEFNNVTVTVSNSASTAWILPVTASAVFRLRDNTPATFDVADGAQEDDLWVALPITQNNTSALNKNGAGRLTLSAASTYGGNTTVNAGALRITESGRLYADAHRTSIVTVQGGGLLELTTWSYGANQSLGMLAANAPQIVLNNGTIRMINSNATSYGRGVTVNASGATLEAAGAGLWSVDNVVDANAWVFNGDPTLTLTGAGTGVFDKVFYGSGTLTKLGSGTWRLGGVSTNAGPVAISNGTLLVQGGLGTGPVTIESGATLGGTGVVLGAVSHIGTIAPGAGIGTLVVSNTITAEAVSILRIELGGTNEAAGYDRLVASDVHTLDGTLEVVTTNGYVPASGDRFVIVTNAGPGGLLFNSFATVNLPALAPGLGWDVQYNGTEYVSLTVTGSVGGTTPYDLWAASITNPALRGEQEDADGDGYANLFEYSQGSDATNASATAKLQLVRTNGVFFALFNRVNTATDIVYVVEGANLPTNGATWLGVATNALGSWGASTNVNDNNTATIHRVWITDPVIGTNRSLRLRITRP